MNIKEAVNQAFDLWQKTYVQIDKADSTILKKVLTSKFITPEFIEYMALAGHREYTSARQYFKDGLTVIDIMVKYEIAKPKFQGSYDFILLDKGHDLFYFIKAKL
jgi:hypothetical protein|nr:MAG TPA: hypothetical protein [Caudoviricetes sp.]